MMAEEIPGVSFHDDRSTYPSRNPKLYNKSSFMHSTGHALRGDPAYSHRFASNTWSFVPCEMLVCRFKSDLLRNIRPFPFFHNGALKLTNKTEANY